MTRLPHVVRALLHRWLPLRDREFVLGDLEEEFEARGAGPAARWWLWRQAIALIWARRRERGGSTEAANGSVLAHETRGRLNAGAGMETVVQDLRYGVRVLGKDRPFSFVAILTLALGIGVSTALFSVIDAAMLRPLPYPNPDELVTISVGVTQRSGAVWNLAPSIADIRDWREAGHVFSHVGMGRFSGTRPPIVDAGEPERLTVGSASEGLLEVFGIRPVLGRLFTQDDTREGAPAVALLGYRYWQDRVAGTPDVIGRVVRIADEPATIVGVLPAGFFDETALWEPERFSAEWALNRGSGTPVYGRLRPGVTLVQAQEAATAVAKAASAARGDTSVVRVVLESMYDDETTGYRKTLTMLAYAVSFILLIACVNVAGLLLARGAGRRAELAVRASLGAGRSRLIRQLLAESLLLSVAGGSLGVLLAWLSLDALVAIIPLQLQENVPPTLNPLVLAAAAGLSLVSALVFGLLPAIKLSRVHLARYLAIAGRRSGPALSRRGGQALIAVEVALAVVLLAGAGLMVRSFDRLLAVDLGFDPNAILSMEVEPVDPAGAVRAQYYDSLLEALRRTPEVAVAGAVNSLPLRGGSTVMFIRTSENSSENLIIRHVLPGYFEAMGLSPKLGRLPTEADRSGEPVIVINEQAAKQFFPDGSPIGRTLQTTSPTDVPRRVVGVIGNVRHWGPLRATYEAEAYRLGIANSGRHSAMTVVLRLRPGASISNARLREIAQSIGPRVVIGEIGYGSDALAERVATPRHRTLLLGLLGGFGLLLTLVGIFSMTAYAVARRTQEIGVRMAFGAQPGDVIRTMVGDAVWPLVLGLAIGLGGAYFATTVIQSFLFETTPHDPATFAAVALLTAIGACLAAWVPARRAAHIDPVNALRAE
jgi:putative ABC transport system permease protein